MTSQNIATVYAAVLHVAGLAALTVLTAMGKIDQTTGLALIGTLLGLGAGVAVNLPGTIPAAAPAAPTFVVTGTPALPASSPAPVPVTTNRDATLVAAPNSV